MLETLNGKYLLKRRIFCSRWWDFAWKNLVNIHVKMVLCFYCQVDYSQKLSNWFFCVVDCGFKIWISNFYRHSRFFFGILIRFWKALPCSLNMWNEEDKHVMSMYLKAAERQPICLRLLDKWFLHHDLSTEII